MTLHKDEKYKEITDNKSFCVAPWTHLHVLPTGQVMPCCFWAQGEVEDYGNFNEHKSVKSTLNHENFKILRKKFLKGQRHAGCKKCYQHDDNKDNNFDSMRKWFNETFKDDEVVDSVLNTQEDGTIETSPIRYLDIRFGNICNLKCRMCGHGLSSTWYDEIKKLVEQEGQPYHNPKFVHVDCYEKIEPLLPYVQQIYFAGGEPILYPEHTKMLDKLIEISNTDCKLRYNTNLSSLHYKKRYMPDIWKNFSDVQVGASIDSMGPNVEYIRTGLKWDRFKSNYETLLHAGHVDLYPAPTIGILNIEDYIDFAKFIIENKWQEASMFQPNFVAWPEEQNPSILPDWYKDELIEKYKNHITWLDKQNKASAVRQKPGIENVINFIQQNTIPKHKHEDLLIRLWKRLWNFNNSANLNWTGSCPKLWHFYKKHAEISDRWYVENGTPYLKAEYDKVYQ